MRLHAITLAIASVLELAASAPEQEIDFGTRITHPKRAEIPQGNLAVYDKGRIALAEFAECAFARHPKQVVEATSRVPGEEGLALSRVATSECLEAGSMQFSSRLFRGALYAEMYRRYTETGGAKWPYPIAPLTMDKVPDTTASDEVRTNFFMLQMTQCLVQKDAGSVRGVISNSVLSKAQDAAFAKLIPQLGECIPRGVTLTLNKTTLENGFGEYLYRSLVPEVQSSAMETK